MTFAEMREAFEKARASAEESRAKQKAKKGADPDAKKGDIKVKARVAVERPSQRENIAGYDTERIFVTITLEAEATPEGQRTEQVGSMVLLLDQWISNHAPQVPAFTEFYRLFSEKLGREFRSQVQGLQAAFASYPSLADGMEAAAREMQKISGIPLRSAMHAVLVPPGLAFDRQLTLDRASVSAATTAASPAEPAEKQKSAGFGGFMKKLNEGLTKEGVFVTGEGLAPPEQARIVRAGKGGGAPEVTDGPFAESKEFLAGYWIVDVESPAQAYAIAARISAAPGAGGKPIYIPIEVREVPSGPPVEP
jgi:hypothetical protein